MYEVKFKKLSKSKAEKPDSRFFILKFRSIKMKKEIQSKVTYGHFGLSERGNMNNATSRGKS